MRKFLTSLLLVASLANCSPITKAAVGAALGGGGTDVNTNAQVGKENRQSFTLGRVEEIRGDKNERAVEAQQVETVNVTNTDNDLILLLVAIAVIGWLLPSPNEIGRWLGSLFTRKKNG